jgi:hypothetical protein
VPEKASTPVTAAADAAWTTALADRYRLEPELAHALGAERFLREIAMTEPVPP